MLKIKPFIRNINQRWTIKNQMRELCLSPSLEGDNPHPSYEYRSIKQIKRNITEDSEEAKPLNPYQTFTKMDQEIEMMLSESSGSYAEEEEEEEEEEEAVEGLQKIHRTKVEFRIFRAPLHIRHDTSYFEPKLVSIGPYYRGRENLQPMEDLKLRCISDLLQNNIPVGESSTNISVPVDLFIEFEEDARSFYQDNFDLYMGDFVRMLVVDSFFIIRIILSVSQEVKHSMGFLNVNIKEVRSDLLLLENQIPLFFIEKVYEWFLSYKKLKEYPPFEFVLAPFICLDMPWRFNHSGMRSGAAHLLDLFWKCSCSPEVFEFLEEDSPDQIVEQERTARSDSVQEEQPSWAEMDLSINAPKVIPNATALHQMVGITFQKLNDTFSQKRELHSEGLVVTFCNGVMRMSCLKIDSRQARLLVNLIAFEHSMYPRKRIFSSYMKLMDALIDTEQDVEFLQRCGVIHNTLSSHEMAATFFNDTGNFCLIDYDKHLFSGIYKDVQRYYDSGWNRRWANLHHNYFGSPWAGISVVAGATLLILTAVQTFYTIYDHYNPKH